MPENVRHVAESNACRRTCATLPRVTHAEERGAARLRGEGLGGRRSGAAARGGMGVAARDAACDCGGGEGGEGVGARHAGDCSEGGRRPST